MHPSKNFKAWSDCFTIRSAVHCVGSGHRSLSMRFQHYLPRTVVHNLFRRRATNRFLKTSGGQTSATTQLMSDKYMKTFTIMTCAVNHKVIEKWIHSTRPIYITVILTLFQ